MAETASGEPFGTVDVMGMEFARTDTQGLFGHIFSELGAGRGPRERSFCTAALRRLHAAKNLFFI